MNLALQQLVKPPKPPRRRPAGRLHRSLYAPEMSKREAAMRDKRLGIAKAPKPRQPSGFEKVMVILLAAPGQWVSADEIRKTLGVTGRSVSDIARFSNRPNIHELIEAKKEKPFGQMGGMTAYYRALITADEWRRMNPGAPINDPDQHHD